MIERTHHTRHTHTTYTPRTHHTQNLRFPAQLPPLVCHAKARARAVVRDAAFDIVYIKGWWSREHLCVNMNGGPVSSTLESSMRSLYGAVGDFNKRKDTADGVVDFANAKRMRSEYFPGGRFDDGGSGGPTSVLDNFGRKPEGLAKNLSNNQTEKTLYVNIPRFIVPVLLPNPHSGGQNKSMTLKKSIVAGDVVFHLRYNSHMINRRVATNVNANTTNPHMCFTVNLPTVNYIIMNLHRYLSFFMEPMLLCGEKASTINDFPKYMVEIKNKTRDLKKNNLDTWADFFKHISVDSGSDAFSQLMDDTDTQEKYMKINTFFGNWYHKKVSGFKDDSSRECDKTHNIVQHNDALEYRRGVLAKYIAKTVWHFIRSYIKVGGVFIGSDHQGGNDQGDNNPCSFLSTDYVGTLQVAGKTLKVKNLWSWSKTGLASGDVLGFRLATQEIFHNDNENNEHEINFHLSSNPTIPHTACLYGAQGRIKTNKIYDNTEKLDPRALEPLVLVPCILNAPMPWEGTKPLRFCEGVPYFLQFGTSNQMSKQFNQSSDQMTYSTNACATSDLVYIEVFMRFDVLYVTDHHTEMVRHIRHKVARTNVKVAADRVKDAAVKALEKAKIARDSAVGDMAKKATQADFDAATLAQTNATEKADDTNTLDNTVAQTALDIGSISSAMPKPTETRQRVQNRPQGGTRKSTVSEEGGGVE